jgi:hypothetical protein
LTGSHQVAIWALQGNAADAEGPLQESLKVELAQMSLGGLALPPVVLVKLLRCADRSISMQQRSQNPTAELNHARA